MSIFEAERFYKTSDTELRKLGTEIRMAQWRSEGVGPVFHRFGRTIRYRGEDLNRWVEEARVEPAAA